MTKATSSRRRKSTKPISTAKAKSLAAVPRDICFVIMPFGGWLDGYYTDIYRPAISDSGLDPHRADDLFRPSTIVNDIWSYTKRAKLILADLSGKNPNVFYELGLAHALAKPAILVADSMDNVPFDLRALRVLVYEKNAPDWGNILREKVKSAIAEVLRSPAEAVLPAFLDTKGTGPKPTLTPQEKEIAELRQQFDLLREEMRSRGRGSDHTISPPEAAEMIKDMLDAGVSDDVIVQRMEPLGPPRNWTIEKIHEIKQTRKPSAEFRQKRVALLRKK
jgi:hypothetical protein